MSERIEPTTELPDGLGVATRILTAQAFVLHDIFFRQADKALSLDRHAAPYHGRKALTAQARCRATFKILLALRAAATDAEKFSNLTEGTIQTLRTPYIANGLTRDVKPATPPRAQPARKWLGARGRWTPERRARQAAAIRSWQPWRQSSGPKTAEGKARSAKNALKHGHRSRTYAEIRREDRRILSLAADNLAIAKLLVRRSPQGEDGSLRALATRASAPPPLGGEAEAPARSKALRVGGYGHCSQFRRPMSHRIGIGRERPALIPFPRKFPGNRGPSGLLPEDNAAPRRRWRIARHDQEDVQFKQG